VVVVYIVGGVHNDNFIKVSNGGGGGGYIVRPRKQRDHKDLEGCYAIKPNRIGGSACYHGLNTTTATADCYAISNTDNG